MTQHNHKKGGYLNKMEANYGFLSVIPAILVIVLALKTKKTLLSLMIGGFVGAVILNGFNPLIALPNMIQYDVFPSIEGNAGTLVLVTIAGGFVNLIKSSGAAKALGDFAAKRIHSKKGAETATFAAAFAFIYTEPNFTLGVIMRPITERFNVARVKLAYLCDGLASTIASLSPVCSYGPYITGLIATQMVMLGMGDNPWPTYWKYIPFNFYAVLSVITVFIVVRTGLDVGPMYVAEQRATRTGQLIGPNDHPIIQEDDKGFVLPEGAKLSLKNIFIPMGTLFVTLFSVIFWTGDIATNGLMGAFLNGKITLGVTCGFITGSLAIGLVAQQSKIFSFSDAIDKWVKGIIDMMEVSIILILAWSLGRILGDLGLKYFVADIISNTGFPPQLVPAIIFMFGAFIGFSTGSSWGTWAILLPIAFPVMYQFGLPVELAVGATISGGLFGDHCSPISDTTILASTASACDHVEHVRTQLPYGLTVAVASVIGFIVSGYTGMMLPGLAVGLAVNVIGLVVLYKIAQKQIANDPEFQPHA